MSSFHFVKLTLGINSGFSESQIDSRRKSQRIEELSALALARTLDKDCQSLLNHGLDMEKYDSDPDDNEKVLKTPRGTSAWEDEIERAPFFAVSGTDARAMPPEGKETELEIRY